MPTQRGSSRKCASSFWRDSVSTGCMRCLSRRSLGGAYRFRAPLRVLLPDAVLRAVEAVVQGRPPGVGHVGADMPAAAAIEGDVSGAEGDLHRTGHAAHVVLAGPLALFGGHLLGHLRAGRRNARERGALLGAILANMAS